MYCLIRKVWCAWLLVSRVTHYCECVPVIVKMTIGNVAFIDI